MKMPEDSNPPFSDDEKETRLTYFTLPMSLNYQRDSYKLWESALKTWNKIAKTVTDNWGAIGNLLKSVDYDYLRLRDIVQREHKSGFPYLSGPKIFNYWCFIIQKYGKVRLRNSEYIEIAPDTHITKCSVILGVITQKESESLTKEQLSERWRTLLHGTGINPIDMHSPLWFWSRNNFQFRLE